MDKGMSHEGARAEVLVWPEGLPDRPAVSLPLRTEQVQKAQEDERNGERKQTCRICGIEKQAPEFYVRKEGTLRRECKKCCTMLSTKRGRLNPEARRRISLAYYYRHNERAKESRRRYRKNNSAKLAESKRKYYRSNPKRFLEYKKLWRIKNREKALAISRRSYQKNKSICLMATKRWAANNPERVALLKVRGHLSRGSFIKPSEWPDELVNTIAENRKIKRHIKHLWQNQATSPNSETNSLTPSTR